MFQSSEFSKPQFLRLKFPRFAVSALLVGTRQCLVVTVLAIAGLLVTLEASATPLLLGKITTGGVGVYYNATGPEAPSNLAFLEAQYEYNIPGGENGAGFQFDNTDLLPVAGEQSFNTTFSGLAFGSSQFGLDLVLASPTGDGSRTVPILAAFDNVDGSVAGATNAGTVDWSINDYKNASPSGPGTPANAIINSVLRGGNGDGSSIVVTSASLTQVGTLFTVDIAGKLISDSLIHWFNPAFGTSTLNSFGLQNTFGFSGQLSYDSANDDGTDRVDFYSGEVSLYAQTVPEPSTFVLLSLGLLAVGLIKRKPRT